MDEMNYSERERFFCSSHTAAIMVYGEALSFTTHQ